MMNGKGAEKCESHDLQPEQYLVRWAVGKADKTGGLKSGYGKVLLRENSGASLDSLR